MASLKELQNTCQHLSSTERIAYYADLSDKVNIEKDSMQDLLTEARFSRERKCIHCGSDHFVKNGKRPDGTQRYLCRDCKKSFLISTKSILSGTHKKLDVWKKYFDCMMNKKTLRESSEECNISMGTAFIWRHKILDAIKELADRVRLDGTIEADETFFDVSFKGNHRSGEFTMPREAHRRGRTTHTEEISDEKVCVMCAINDTGIPYSKVGKTGMVNPECVARAFEGRIDSHSILCTENDRAYISLATDKDIEITRIHTDTRPKEGHGIQRINAYHSRLKGFIRHFKGVSTKYLDNYLTWNNLMFCSAEKRDATGRLLFAYAITSKKRILGRDIGRRAPIPSLV